MLKIDIMKASESNNASYALKALLSPDKKKPAGDLSPDKKKPAGDFLALRKSPTATFAGTESPSFRGRNSLFEKTASFGV